MGRDQGTCITNADAELAERQMLRRLAGRKQGRSSEAEQRAFNPKRGISKFPAPTISESEPSGARDGLLNQSLDQSGADRDRRSPPLTEGSAG